MEFIDTPNPNAKKLEVKHSYEIATYLSADSDHSPEISYLINHPGVESIFTGPSFLTVLKKESVSWSDIIKDLSDNT